MINYKDFFKATETLVVFGGALLTFLLGKFWLLPMVIVYSLINLPNLRKWIKDKFKN